MFLHGSHILVWLALASLCALPLMAISWRGSEAVREAVAFRAFVRRLREFLDGRSHSYADGVIVEGHLAERLASIQLLSIDGQNQMLVNLACGRSPLLHILPLTAKRSPGLEPYIEPMHSVSLLHSIWTDDIAATGAFLSNEDNLRTVRQFCLHRNSSLRIGNGTIEFHGPVPSSGDYFDNIRSATLKLAGIAAAFERERVKLPRSYGRRLAAIAVALICVLVVSALAAPSVRSMFTGKKPTVNLIHYDPSPVKGWRGVTSNDFDPDDLAWSAQLHQAPEPITYVDFDGTGEQSGTLHFLRRMNEDDAPFRVICYDHGKQLSDDTYPNVAYVLKFDAIAAKGAKWIGTAPAKLPTKGEALLVVSSRKDIKSGVVYLFANGMVEKYRPADFRFP